MPVAYWRSRQRNLKPPVRFPMLDRQCQCDRRLEEMENILKQQSNNISVGFKILGPAGNWFEVDILVSLAFCTCPTCWLPTVPYELFDHGIFVTIIPNVVMAILNP